MKSRSSLVAAFAALCCGVAAAGYPLLLSDSGLTAFLGALGLVALLAGVIGAFTALSIAGAAVLIAQYIVALLLSGTSFDYLSAAYAVVLLLLIELVDLAIAWRSQAPSRAVLAERIGYLVTVVAVGAVVAWLAEIAGNLVTSSLALLGLGAVGGISAIALPLYFVRRVLRTDPDV